MLHTISNRSCNIIQTSFPVIHNRHFARKPSSRPLPASIFFRDLEMKLIQDETIPEFDDTNSALNESKRSDARWVGLTSRRDELGGDKSHHDETIWGVDETNSSATRRISPIQDEEVDETISVHNETNRNNDSTTQCQFSLGSDFILPKQVDCEFKDKRGGWLRRQTSTILITWLCLSDEKGERLWSHSSAWFINGVFWSIL